ncbi:MAG: carbonic anhydrase family protein [Gemmatimonadota bacterium]|nr:MAG: carbonic anhydrase family protein [Gemmatimonadota bacterium]
MVAAVAVLSLASCSRTETASDEHGAVHWGYEAEDGPETWGSMNSEWALCADGLEQSPIDLSNASLTELPGVGIHLPSGQEVEVLNQAGVIDALDNGHTIQINSKTGETLTVGDKTYALVQFHFHAPSEHTVNGGHFPMEMHFVHQAEDGALAVIGVLIEEGAENESIQPLWEQLAAATGAQAAIRIPPEFADHIFTGDPTGVFHYRGSLTTPPCSEGVDWFVRRTPTQLSQDQIAAFTAVYDHNNRPVQALNSRTLYLDESPAVTIH